MRYLALHTRVPVPRVYSWNSDASDPVGVEYMIMQKVGYYVPFVRILILSLITVSYCSRCLGCQQILSWNPFPLMQQSDS
jgi:hypothetical protein